MIDIHSHIIPFIDDGAEDEEMSAAMIEKAIEGGTKKLVATPHYRYGLYEFEFSNLEERVNKIRKIAKRIGKIEVYVGQEVFYSSKLLEYYKEKKIGTINNTRYMLIELPMGGFNISEVIETIYELQIRDITPIIAHPERYVPFIQNPEIINEFVKEGYLFQLDIGSLTGMFGNRVNKLAKKLIDKKIYNFIGSDAHKSEFRDTDMREGVKKIDSSYFEFINESSLKMLEDKEVRFIGEKILKKSIWSIFGKNN